MQRPFSAFGLLFAVLALVQTARADLVINEFLASNRQTLADRDGDFSDWIEILNTGPAVVNLAGWSLTDDATRPDKWKFPATNLNVGAFLLVFASGKDSTNAGTELHTSFSLNADGEYLGLYPPESTQAASEFAPQYPSQQPDVSFGYSEGRAVYFKPPTPRAANGAGFADFVADTKFSHNRGFYDQPFDLVITCATPNAVIRYTTNGATPTATTGLVYSGPIPIAGTKVIRAMASMTGMIPSGVDTQTYLFPTDIFQQSPNGKAPPGWPATWGNNVVDYGMDPDVVNSPLYKNELRSALMSLPSFILVTDFKNLFDASTGIYANPGQDGRAWERPASLELINPSGAPGFQVNCGVRIRGGFSRDTSNPKHALRFFFREQYGASKLRYPLFGDQGTDTFDAFDLRTFQNYSWSFQGDSRGVFIRDQFNRDSQLAMGSQAERGNYYHLFINGQYWGLYNTCERPEASYGETYYGGKQSDYDVVKVEAGPYQINATDGNLTAWTSLYTALRTVPVSDATYLKLQGKNSDGTVNPDYPPLLDVDNLIDYMLVIYFGGNLDAPISWFLGNASPNNFYGMRDRTGQMGGFKFFVHDAEHTLLSVDENRIGPFSAGSSSITKSNPQYFFQQLMSNAQFKLRVADRVQRAFFNNGPLTPAANQARVARRTNEIYSAVVLESARWGDSKRAQPFTRNVEWRAELDRIQNEYFPQRTSVVLNQLRAQGWLPSVEAAKFSQHGGPFSAGAAITITAAAGSIYFTTDGTDPRLPNGSVAPTAQLYSSPVVLTDNTTLKARVRSGTSTWSALTEADFVLIQTWTDVVITELMYHPGTNGTTNPDDLEFIELKNLSGQERNLGGLQFTNGIRYTFPNGTRLAPGQFVVLVSHIAAFTNRYPDVIPFGEYSGKLSNSGERLTLVHAAGAPLLDFSWGTSTPWPSSADGTGFSLVPRQANVVFDPTDPTQWRASANIGGSPGADDPSPNIPTVVVNEVLTHTDLPQLDAIELYNPTDTDANLAGWYLTDDRQQPKKFRIPTGKVVPAHGYLVFNEGDFNAPGSPFAFSLSSHGDEVFLFSGDPAGNLTGYSDGTSFGAAANGVSFGRYTNSVGEIQFPPQKSLTLGSVNSGPKAGPVVVNEFSYDPLASDVEYIEIKNTSAVAVPLFDPATPTNTWRLSGYDFAFPEGVTLAPGGLAVVTSGDPTLFRLRWSIPDSVPVFGPASGNLEDNGERLELQRPDSPDLVTNQFGVVKVVVPYIAVDQVRYSNRAPWPVEAAGQGASLERRDVLQWADDPAAWRAAPAGPSPGLENNVNRPPRPDAGADQQLVASKFPLEATLSATAVDDGQPGGPLQFAWSQISGPAGATLVTPQGASTVVRLPGQGVFGFRVTVSDGERAASDEVLIDVSRSAGDAVFLAAGSTWKYSDLGLNLDTAWRQPGFDDSSWASGKGKLGYGDPDEVTTIGFGPDSNNKYITTYFRAAFDLDDASSVTELTAHLMRDDGAVIYLNGTEVARSNMPETAIDWKSLANSAIGGADESAYNDIALDRAALRAGKNVVAVEVHQSGGGSSDLGFDLALTGRRVPVNTAPTAEAGPALTVTAGAWTPLNGDFTDDGLPQSPGAPAFAWSKVSGPGPVEFANALLPVTQARFATAGDYVLRFTVNDGVFNAEDTVAVTVLPDLTQPPVLEVVLNTKPLLRFSAQPNQSYTLLVRDSLNAGAWRKLQDFAAKPQTQLVEIPVESDATQGFYQLVTPALP